MKIKTSELKDKALDWAVATCEGVDELLFESHDVGRFHYSTDWSQGGPIIEREKITLRPDKDGWIAYAKGKMLDIGFPMCGPTPLVAAMRCYVASRLGDEVDIPDEVFQ